MVRPIRLDPAASRTPSGWWLIVRWCLMLACVSLVTGFGADPVATTSRPVSAATERVLLVLDASGSMRDRIKGESKQAIARRAVRELLKDWNPAIPVGLFAYSHRRDNACDDFEMIVPVGLGTSEAIVTAVDALAARGRTPLYRAIEKAALEMAATGEPATLVVVTDGADTCDRDPCAKLRALAATGIKLTTHIIGFDVSNRGDREQLECLAAAGHGRFIAASDAAELGAALGTIAQAVREELAVNLRLRVTFPGIEPPPEDEHRHAIRAAAGDASGVRQVSPDEFALPAGDYLVTTEFRDVRVETPVTVSATELTELEVVVVSARLALEVRVGGEPAPAGEVSHFIRPAGDAASGPQVNRDTNARDFTIPPGSYVVETRYRDIRRTTAVDLAPAANETRVLELGATGLTLQARLADDSAPPSAEVFHWIYAAATGTAGTPVNADSSAAKFSLPPGDYVVRTRFRELEVETPVTITEGRTTAATVLLRAAEVTLRTTLNGGLSAAPREIYHFIRRAESGRSGATVSTNSSATTFTLPPGAYEIETRFRDVRQFTPLAVKAGGPMTVGIVIAAGRVQLATRLSDGSAPVDREVYHYIYQVENGRNGRQASGNSSGREFFLAPGTYRIETRYRTQRVNTDLTVRDGGSETLTITLPGS